MRKGSKLILLLSLIGLAYLGSEAMYRQSTATAYHSSGELDFFRGNGMALPLADNGFFKTAGHCDGCHGTDPLGIASVNSEGVDISPVENWRATMMANSARDPFWKAKVSHEVTVNPVHQSALENKCTSCHAPMGKFAYDHYNAGPYSMEILATDEVGQDGVSCLACHKMSDVNIGNTNSGNLHYSNLAVAYGPFEKPFEPPMQEFVSMIPLYSPHINDAGLCAGCHTLLTESVDLSGNFTGSTFVEQATYHEWLNSQFSVEGTEVTCQGCHMPRVSEPVILSANHNFLPPRSPYGKHELVGGNTFMLKLMKQNREALNIPSNETHFDTVIARTERLLQQQTLDMELTMSGYAADTAFYEVKLTNRAGHKFPSGYPSRRAFIEFVMLKENGDTLFSSGAFQDNYEVQGQDSDYEPHYRTIRESHQVQIYEMVMGDVNGNVTTVLERAFAHLKDNRLAPRGFTTAHEVYDTTAIRGAALNDPDFNFDGFEGSGTDRIGYHIALNGYEGTVTTRARVYYQPLPPKGMEEMFAQSTPEIDLFRPMYENADHTPVLVAQDSMVGIQIVTGVNGRDPNREWNVYPNPTADGHLRWRNDGKAPRTIEVYSASGSFVMSVAGDRQHLQLPDAKGVYHLRALFDDGRSVMRKVVRR
ncbi:MAG: T9SS type A sorting domain-containing protein [Flavobacteriales bacterium]|nr:T9SS type A sorting domain-containing protein [Flavobacteriales bacterium]